MNIDIKDLLTLSDGKNYVVVSKANNNGINYYYLVDIDENENAKICYLDNNELVEIQDKKFISKLLPLLLEPVKI